MFIYTYMYVYNNTNMVIIMIIVNKNNDKIITLSVHDVNIDCISFNMDYLS
jgi:hypothetical protein